MPRVISWGVGGKLEIDKMVIINQGRVKIVFEDRTSVDMVALDDATIEFQTYDAEGNFVTSEPADTGWAGHA